MASEFLVYLETLVLMYCDDQKKMMGEGISKILDCSRFVMH